MQGRFVSLFLCVLSVLVFASSGAASATQPGLQALLRPATGRPLLLKAGGGCGWDYPCAPDPGFGRPLYLRDGEDFIHNGDGPFNFYPGDSAREEEERGYGREVSRRDRCGPLCWLRRFRHGYCGHGCLAYREQARAEAEAREDDAMREFDSRAEGPFCGERRRCREGCPEPRCRRAYAPPPPRPAYYYREPRRAYAPSRRTPARIEPPHRESLRDKLMPRKRFEGPPYPGQ